MTSQVTSRPETQPDLDPITLSVMVQAFVGIAEEMGSILIRGDYSANIKERQDCSAALFDEHGRTVAQAEHIPVHLGAMPEAVATVIARDPQPGDVFVLNDPYHGGSHLPDVTMVAPITYRDTIVGYAATRAHHADIGGTRAGSMPADSTELYQEGLIIPPVRLVHAGQLNTDVLDLLVANVRTARISRGDYQAQAAANRVAATRLVELIERYDLATVQAAFDAVITYTERRTREAIQALPDGTYRASTEIEGDGTTTEDIPIVVTVTVAGDHITMDFTGTAPPAAGNVNCPLAVTQSACSFALRLLLPSDVPANAGTFAPLKVRVPENSVLSANPPAAVCAGNVETSSRIADVALAALAQATDLPAPGQGTMNVLAIGGADWSYVETLGGGQGANRHGPGSSGVHVAMTNTLNTPVEAVELAYPLRVERYELRDHTGGAGHQPGGDGLVRSLRALDSATVSLLTDRRRHGPPGVRGGQPGQPGRNLLNDTVLPAKASTPLNAGDLVSIETPGGGGWGHPPNTPEEPHPGGDPGEAHTGDKEVR
jgi:N-methylhydantoinase B